jgi:hypothetical protein
MNPYDAPHQEPAEHLRFAAYLNELAQATDTDEIALVHSVLTDPDQTMAQAAVLRHLDRRAADLHPGPAFQPWAEAMSRAAQGHPLLARRLREWTLLRALQVGQPWHHQALLTSSDWLQRHAATTTSNIEALQLLAERGRTKRIRTTAEASLKQHSNR